MNKLDEITLADIARTLKRYQPFIGVVIAILLVVAFLPGAATTEITAAGTAPPGSATAGVAAGEGATSVQTGEAGAADPNAPVADAPALEGGGSAPSSGGAQATGGSGEMVANCDPATGRIKVPSKFAAPCVPRFDGDNGGSTARGVSGDTIKIAWYEVREDAATDSVLTAAGANDSTDLQRQQVKDWIEYYSSHYQLYGRKVEVVFVPASGESTDSAAARADAIKIAEEIKAFAAINGPGSNVYVDELVARGVMCFCTVSQPQENYERWAPYVWSTLAASTQMYIHRAEYVGRLAGKPAKWAGSPTFQSQQRKFGLLYYDTDDRSYKPGIDFFVSQLRDKYGVDLAAVVEYHGYPQTARSQEEARPAIQKLSNAGVTSVICVCDPFGPIFMTSEATRQLYQPEWVITGSALTDTSFFGRLYDQAQWAHAFGVSALAGRLPEKLGEAYRLHTWHFGKEPSAPNAYGVLRFPLDIFFTGVHMAGPKLEAGTFRNGMWSVPPAGVGGKTANAQSFGRHGIWPWDDYTGYDDTTEVWWDPQAEGEDELSNNGRGLYRYVDMGLRHLPGRWPRTEPKAFDPANTITIYEKPPPEDQWPEYPPPNR